MRPQVVLVTTVLLNATLFAVNFWIALLSGSRTILAEAILTATDLAGSALLLWGARLSRRPADLQHPFGFGKERFFWAFVSIVITFTIAGIVALVTGIDQWAHPRPIGHLLEGVLIVSATLVASAIGISVTLRELRLGRETLQGLLESSHEGLKAVFYQDAVAIVGAVIALGGLLAIYETHQDAIDGIVAAVEGVLLVATGFVLTAESREYLIGRALAPSVAREILGLVERDPRVGRVRSIQSMQLGPDDALVALRINFQDGLTTDQLESAIDQVSLAVRSAYPIVRHLIIEPES
ncbi:MAG TPA: cation diffusion facilitator family transporter [Thermoplasmata archaeon]|nr:cation diffusion facilitator family transporter [Thermoplasmata archaeon]